MSDATPRSAPSPSAPPPDEPAAAPRGAPPGRAASPAAIASALPEQLRLWQRFHIRLSVFHGAVVLVTVLLLGALLSHRLVESETNVLKTRLRTAAVTLGHAIRPELVRALSAEGADRSSPAYRELVGLFAALAKDEPDVSSIYVLRPSGDPGWLIFCADYMPDDEPAEVGQRYDVTQAPVMLEGFLHAAVEDEPYSDEWGPVLSAYAPIRDREGVALAIVGIDLPAGRIAEVRRQVLVLTLGGLAAAVVLMALVSWLVGQNVRHPLSSIIEATSAIAQGRFDVRSSLVREDEFGVLGRHFDQMAAGLQEREFIREAFGRYLSPGVARKILAEKIDGAQLGGQLREVSVLFTDLAGYSTICESLSPTQIVGVLNTYLGAAADLVEEHEGCVIEFLGDSVFAVFGAPNDLPDHAARAVRCALAIRQRMDVLNQQWESSGVADLWRQRGIDRLWSRAAIHSGVVVAGNLGSRTRIKYGVLGDAVNVASRVETLNKELSTDLLITADTWLRLPPDLKAVATSRGSHPVKGRQQPVVVHAL